jgi:acyl carrier protein
MIFEKVQEKIAEQLGIDEDEITMESDIHDDLGADSLDFVELVVVLEEEFDLEIPDKDLDEIDTVGDIVEYIKEHR